MDSRNSHRGIELDQPLHRIFPVWHLELAVRLKQLTLVKPSLWIDPAEDPCANFMLDPGGNPEKHQQSLSDYLRPCWAQCWSFEADSDVLLRAYSRVILDPLIRRNIDPSNEGVRVTTTARRLIATMEQWAIQHESDHFFIAPVTYEKPDHFRQSLVNQLSRPEGPNHFRSPDARADSLLVKRSMFQDEREVRILCVGTGQLHEGDKIRAMPILPNHLFTEVRFDPRLTAFERREREETLRKLGYEGTFVDDGSYVPVLTLVPLPNGWPSPE